MFQLVTGLQASRRSPLHRSGSLPIAAWRIAGICKDELREIVGIADKLLANDPVLNAIEAFGPLAKQGLGRGPALCIGDHGDTALIPESALAGYDYRIASLARDGDSTVIYGPRDHAFETYRRDVLDLGSLHVAEIPPAPDCRKQLAFRACRDDDLVLNLVEQAKAAGALTIVPYQGNGGVWALASRIANGSNTPVHVCAPPPRLARCVNNKTWFARRVVDIFGRQARPDQAFVYGPSALVAYVSRMNRKSGHIVVKVPSSAGSLGNINLRPGYAEKLPVACLRDDLLSQLGERGWRGAFPLLIEAWDDKVMSSPSVHIWIPLPGEEPIVEGVFDQAVEGSDSRFVGAVPCNLPDPLVAQLCKEASLMAHLLQMLGYFGRCSFDSVVAGESHDQAVVHWIECNGRWGGVSIPMTLSNRLTSDWVNDPEIVIFSHQFVSQPPTTARVLACLEPMLFKKDGQSGGVVLLAPPRMSAKLQVLAISKSSAEAREIANWTRQALEQIPCQFGGTEEDGC